MKREMADNKNNQAEKYQGAPLKELFLDELKSIYWVEVHLLKALPLLAEKTDSSETVQAFENHLQTVKENCGRLEKIFDIIGIEATEKTSAPMVEILRNCEDLISHTEQNSIARESGLLLSGQKLAHYKIASYGGMATLAKTIDLDDVPSLLKIIIQEEKAMSTLLFSIAESHINLSGNEKES